MPLTWVKGTQRNKDGTIVGDDPNYVETEDRRYTVCRVRVARGVLVEVYARQYDDKGQRIAPLSLGFADSLGAGKRIAEEYDNGHSSKVA